MHGGRYGWMAVLALWAWFAAAAACAQTPASPHIRIALVAETSSPRAASEVTLAFAAQPQPGWHGYWKNPGDAGVETTAAWTLPRGLTAGPLRYPVPQRLLIAGLMNYVYEGPFAEFVTLRVPLGLTPGTRLPVAVTLDYLVCTAEICVPERQSLSTMLTIGDGAVDPAVRARFDAWRRAMPKPLGAVARYAVDHGTLRLAVPFPASGAAKDAYFYPLTSDTIDHAAPQSVSRDGDLLTVATKAKAVPTGAIEGVLAMGDGTGLTIRAVPGDVAASRGGAGLGAALLAFGGAVLGGLLLNVMPCVFPILSLKALALARSGGESAKREAVAYTAGVVVVCVALGALLLALRAGGASVGWAFQLQDPRVILLLLLLVTGIAFNLAGLFELAAPASVNRLAAGGGGGAFATGALAAFVATPCTGPFMGAALGAALVLPAWGALAIFGGLGLGLALPFLALGFSPRLRARLPRPGAWMETMRRILSLPMFATALALAWVLGRQAGVDGMTIGLAAAVLAAAGLWWTGVRQARGRARAWLPGTVAVLVALGGTALVTRAPVAAAPTRGEEPFSEARLTALRAAGTPVFAYFTADWCLTCKVNERAVIDTAEVRDALRRGGVTVLAGDWTDGDPTLGRFIEAHNRAGVPLYLWYAPGAAEPDVLPQLLTRGGMIERAFPHNGG